MDNQVAILAASGANAHCLRHYNRTSSGDTYTYVDYRECAFDHGSTSGGYIWKYWGTIFDLSDYGWAGAKDSDAVLYRAEISISVKADSELDDNTTNPIVKLYSMEAAYSGSASTDYQNATANGNLLKTWHLANLMPTGENYTLTATVTDAAQIAKMVKFGLSVQPGTPTYTVGDDVFAGCTVNGIMLTVYYDGKYSKPTVTIVSGTVKAAASDNATVYWSFSQPIGKTQSAIDVQIRRSGSQADSDWVSVATNLSRSAANYSFAPKNFVTLYAPDTLWEVRVRAKSADSEWSEWASGTVRVIVPRAANLSPSGGSSFLIEADVRLSWTVVCTADGAAVPITNKTAYCDLQYSTDGGESWRSLRSNQQASVSGSTYYYVAAAGTFPTGIIQWRVRFRYTTNGAQDEFVSEAFTIRVNPSTSSVECDGKPHPTLTWDSAQQIAYQVRFADYDSGVRYGSEQTFTVPYVYPDGEYAVSVRSQASDGSWSAWTEMEYVFIENVPITGTVTLTATATAHAALLVWTAISGTTAILYRDGVPVYVGEGTTFTDAFVNGSATYQVRAVASSGYYAESAETAVDAVPISDCLYDGENWYDLKLSSNPRQRSWQQSQEVVYRNYAGREKPVAFTAGHVSRGFAGSYVLLNRTEANRVMALTGRAVLFKDTDGGMIYGILNDVTALAKRKTVEIGFTVTEIDRIEEVELV